MSHPLGNVPNVCPQLPSRREAQNASATAGGPKRIMSEASRASAGRSAAGRAPLSAISAWTARGAANPGCRRFSAGALRSRGFPEVNSIESRAPSVQPESRRNPMLSRVGISWPQRRGSFVWFERVSSTNRFGPTHARLRRHGRDTITRSSTGTELQPNRSPRPDRARTRSFGQRAYFSAYGQEVCPTYCTAIVVDHPAVAACRRSRRC